MRGVCDEIQGVCTCFEGYSGEDCTVGNGHYVYIVFSGIRLSAMEGLRTDEIRERMQSLLETLFGVDIYVMDAELKGTGERLQAKVEILVAKKQDQQVLLTKVSEYKENPALPTLEVKDVSESKYGSGGTAGAIFALSLFSIGSILGFVAYRKNQQSPTPFQV